MGLAKLELIWKRLKPLKGLLLLAGVQIALSTAYIIKLAAAFNYGRRLVVVHLLIVAGLLGGLLSLAAGAAFVSRAGRRGWLRLALYFIPAATAWQVLIYVGDFLSNRYWGDNIHYKLAGEALSRPLQHLQLLPDDLGWLLAALLAVVVAGVVGYALWLSQALKSLAESLTEQGVINRQSELKWSLALCLLMSGVAAIGVRQSLTWGAARREPLISFFTPGRFLENDAVAKPSRPRTSGIVRNTETPGTTSSARTSS